MDNSFGYVLGQHYETGKKEQAIYYLSKKFTNYEVKYTLLERTCCALTWVAQNLRHYLLAYTTYLISIMDPLKYIFQKPMPTRKLAKWQILLTEFDIVYVTRTAMKAQTLAYHLAENSVDDDYKPLSTYFPNKEVNSIEEVVLDDIRVWKMYFDGAVNIKGVGIGAMLISPIGKHYLQQLDFISSIHGDLIHSPPLELHPMSFLWGMDVIGPIEPKVSNWNRFILVAIDYFTKWVEAVTFKAATKKAMVDFIHSNIIYRFGIPKTIITDNVGNLNSYLMKEVCEQFKIVHHHSTPYRPKANGVVEAANKNIKKILRKMIQGSGQWHEKLPFALLGYHMTARTSVGATLYMLVYGTEAVIPAEVEIPSLRIIVESEIEDTKWVKPRLE
ncbi:uncharacterized protein [Nicotiana tomentosiformis]|uniref:uncharacterized protein n=1 Tax=Nicotiana tomentosiformis TaxID=4098 RepID=UPI00388C9EC1